MHDEFEWWAYIWIPALVGVATIVVAVVASVVSWNAARLAHRIESLRVADDERRASEAASERLATMASQEARILRRWLLEEARPGGFGFSRRINEPPPPRTPLDVARVEAEVALEVSLVPGASDLFRLTVFDLSSSRPKWADRKGGSSRQVSLPEQSEILPRTHRRIRSWGLDPEEAAKSISAEWQLALENEAQYLGFDPEWDPNEVVERDIDTPVDAVASDSGAS